MYLIGIRTIISLDCLLRRRKRDVISLFAENCIECNYCAEMYYIYIARKTHPRFSAFSLSGEKRERN